MNNEFDNEEKYKLYRSVKELLHPSISKKNISNYKIIIDDKLLPLRIEYPKKVSNINRVIVYLHGEGLITNCSKDYTSISKNISHNYNALVISLDYDEYKSSSASLDNLILSTIKEIYNNISTLVENIILLGDSTGATTILHITPKLIENNIYFKKYILFYPVLKITSSKENDYYKDNNYLPIDYKLELPSTLIITGITDSSVNEMRKFKNINESITLKEIKFAHHGFLNTKDKAIIYEYNKSINNFL